MNVALPQLRMAFDPRFIVAVCAQRSAGTYHCVFHLSPGFKILSKAAASRASFGRAFAETIDCFGASLHRSHIAMEADVFGSIAATDDIINTVVNFVRKGDRAHLRALDMFPAALYVTDAHGFITYYNPACIDFAGRTPVLGQDRWCVTWKLYTAAGDLLPHDRCPMAIAIQTKRIVRGSIAIAERPDGSRVKFLPFPTPVVGGHGELRGAVNVLVAVTDHNEPVPSDHDLRAWLNPFVDQALATFTLQEIRTLVCEIETELGSQPPHSLQ